jgi:hypothetical protein
VYIQSENNYPTSPSHMTSDSVRKMPFVESGDDYVPAEPIFPQPTCETGEQCDYHLPPSVAISQSYVPSKNSVDGDTRSPSGGLKCLVTSALSQSGASLSSPDGFILMDSLYNQPGNLTPRKLSPSFPEDRDLDASAENLHEKDRLKGDSDNRCRLPNGIVNGLHFPSERWQ